jgi:hypothetical protein
MVAASDEQGHGAIVITGHAEQEADNVWPQPKGHCYERARVVLLRTASSTATNHTQTLYAMSGTPMNVDEPQIYDAESEKAADDCSTSSDLLVLRRESTRSEPGSPQSSASLCATEAGVQASALRLSKPPVAETVSEAHDRYGVRCGHAARWPSHAPRALLVGSCSTSLRRAGMKEGGLMRTF